MALHPNFPQNPRTQLATPQCAGSQPTKSCGTPATVNSFPRSSTKSAKRSKRGERQGYGDAAETSKSLLNWWFNTPHLMEGADGEISEFQYYFAQREALETVPSTCTMSLG